MRVKPTDFPIGATVKVIRVANAADDYRARFVGDVGAVVGTGYGQVKVAFPCWETYGWPFRPQWLACQTGEAGDDPCLADGLEHEPAFDGALPVLQGLDRPGA